MAGFDFGWLGQSLVNRASPQPPVETPPPGAPYVPSYGSPGMVTDPWTRTPLADVLSPLGARLTESVIGEGGIGEFLPGIGDAMDARYAGEQVWNAGEAAVEGRWNQVAPFLAMASVAGMGALPGVDAPNMRHALPMDEASRMARAKDMGFDTDAYHGTVTKHDFDSFERFDRRGNRIESYFAPESKVDFANSFAAADQGRIYPVKLKTEGFLDTRIPEHREVFEELLAERGLVKGVDWNYAKRTDGDPVLPGWGNPTIIDAVNKAGYPGMVIQERPSFESFAVFDPSKIRSKFAKFDPAKKDSKDILAGIAALLALPSLAMMGSDSEAQASE